MKNFNFKFGLIPSAFNIDKKININFIVDFVTDVLFYFQKYIQNAVIQMILQHFLYNELPRIKKYNILNLVSKILKHNTKILKLALSFYLKTVKSLI